MAIVNLIRQEFKSDLKYLLKEELSELCLSIERVIKDSARLKFGRWLTVHQACDYYGFKSALGLKSFVQKNQINTNGKSGKELRIDKDSLDSLSVQDTINNYVITIKR